MYVRLEYVEGVAGRIKTLWFRPEQPVRYTAGQFTELYLPHSNHDDRGIRRWFTLSSSPTEELLGVTTRFETVQSSTFKQQLANIKPGTRLHLADPMGDFVLPKDPTIPIVFIAAGLGITPVRSMIKSLQDTGEQRDVQLIYAAPQDELAFEQLFKQYSRRYTPITTRQRQKLSAPALLNLIDARQPRIYISGPELLVETLYKQLQTAGIDSGRLVADYFPGYRPVG